MALGKQQYRCPKSNGSFNPKLVFTLISVIRQRLTRYYLWNKHEFLRKHNSVFSFSFYHAGFYAHKRLTFRACSLSGKRQQLNVRPATTVEHKHIKAQWKNDYLSDGIVTCETLSKRIRNY